MAEQWTPEIRQWADTLHVLADCVRTGKDLDGEPVEPDEIAWDLRHIANCLAGDKDTILLPLWKQLIRREHHYAAVGMLRDAFDGLAHVIKKDFSNLEDINQLIREEMMMILADKDGSKLLEWLKLFQEDMDTWNQRADAWVTQCQEEERRQRQ